MKKLTSLLALFIFSLILTGCGKKAVPTTQTPARQTEQINQLAITERPFVNLFPRTDGKELSIVVDQVKNATKLEYEVEYTTKDIISGFFGTIDLAKETLPVTKKGLFGTCSKNVCRYDEGVSGGSLVLRLEGGDKAYALKTEFNLQQMFDRQGIFTSKDAKAILDVGKTGLANNAYVVISGTMGLPPTTTGTVIAGPYSFLGANSASLTKATITIQSKEDLTGSKLMFWNGKTLTELKSEIIEGKISAPATALGTFVVVK